jgi:hypothetical protein
LNGPCGRKFAREHVARRRDRLRLVIVDALDEARHFTETGGARRGQPLAARDHDVTAATVADEERLQNPMPLDGIDKCHRRRRDIVGARIVDGVHIHEPNGGVEQG